MPLYQSGDVHIRYEETALGFRFWSLRAAA